MNLRFTTLDKAYYKLQINKNALFKAILQFNVSIRKPQLKKLRLS